MSWALAGLTTGGAPGTGVAFLLLAGGAIFLGGAGFADTLGSATLVAGAGAAAVTDDGVDADTTPDASSDARRRRATGASTVLEADLTYSPIS
jgi:hypothetical protein